MKRLPKKAILTAIFCNVLFGSAVPMIKLGYQALHITDDMFSKILFAGVRFFLSGLIVLAVDTCREKKFVQVPKENRKYIISVALIYTFLQYLFNYIGLSNTSGALSSVLVSTSAFLSVIFAHFVYQNDKMNLQKIAGTVIGFVGVVIACSTGENLGRLSFMGEGFILISTTCFVVGSLFNKKATQRNTSFTVTSYNLIIGGGLLAFVGIIGYQGGITLSIAGIGILCYLIMVSSVGFTLWSSLLRKYPIGLLGVYNFVIPVSGGLLSGIILGENVWNIQYLLAFCLVGVGIVTVNFKRE